MTKTMIRAQEKNPHESMNLADKRKSAGTDLQAAFSADENAGEMNAH